MTRIFTSESVTEGHPDKVADQISDAILDAILTKDPHARVACEVLVNTGLVVVSGEITTHAYVDIRSIVRDTICQIGYDSAETYFDGNSCGVIVSIDEQSPDIAQGVDQANDVIGAGDQGMMFGYASNETETLMPFPIQMAHELAHRLSEVRKNKTLPYIRPDGKTQVSFEYDKDKKPVRLHTVVISTQHAASVTQKELKAGVLEHVIQPVVSDWIDEKTIVHINPTGKFVIGGPQGDCGLTGRKTMVDTYGSCARHGGGAFSGKDPSKVDRSGAYMARYIAKNLVANGLAEQCEIQLSYAIGVAEPVSVWVETFGTSEYTPEVLEKVIRDNFDLTPAGIIQTLDLLRPIYKQTASYGHFGRKDISLPWENIIEIQKPA